MKKLTGVNVQNPFLAVLGFLLIGTAIALLVSPICPLALVPGILLAVAMVLGRWPEIGLYVIVSVIPLASVRGLQGDLSFIRIHWLVGAFLAFLMLFRILPRKQLLANLRSNLWVRVLVFMVVMFVATLLSPYRTAAMQEFLLYVAGYLFVAVLMAFLPAHGLTHTLPTVVLLSVAVGTAFGLWSHLFGGEVRTRGWALSANNMALMILYALPLLVYWMFYARRRLTRAITPVLVFISLAGLVTTYSRAGAIVFVVTLAGIVVVHRRRMTPRKMGVIFSSGLLAVVLALMLIPAEYWQRQASITDETDYSISRRKGYIECSLEFFRRRPLLGWGPACFQYVWADSVYARRYQPEPHPEVGYRRKAHNAFLEVLIGSGAIGLAVFLSILWLAFRDFGRAERAFLQRGEESMAQLVGSYRVGFISVLAYMPMSSNENHKYLLLSLALSQVCLRLASKAPESSSAPVDVPGTTE